MCIFNVCAISVSEFPDFHLGCVVNHFPRGYHIFKVFPMILQVLAPLVRIDRQSARNAGQKGGGEQPLNALEFDRLVQKYQSLVYTICRQLVADEGYAQDLTQETFLSAWRSMDRCPAGYEKQWLARIASNKAKDYLRSAWARRVNTPGDDVLALEGAPPGSEPEAQVLEALGEEELTQRILALREPYKTPCRLMLLEQHTAAEAARLCGRPQKTVEAQVFRAKKMLAAQLSAAGKEGF